MMMPPPAEVAAFVDRAERIETFTSGRLLRLPRLDRRRLLAEAVFKILRSDWDEALTPEPAPVSGQ